MKKYVLFSGLAFNAVYSTAMDVSSDINVLTVFVLFFSA